VVEGGDGVGRGYWNYGDGLLGAVYKLCAGEMRVLLLGKVMSFR
jgi:hypothetical protein